VKKKWSNKACYGVLPWFSNILHVSFPCGPEFIYGPILIVQMPDPSTAAQVEGIDYFADTLRFAGAILALASAKPRTD
jgi:hypothetical protein